MHRNLANFLAALMVLALALEAGAPAADTARGAFVNRGVNSKAITLKERLETGLRARRPQEFTYIAMVAQRVDEGTLPQSLVDSTFLWARNKKPYPFPYFKQALELRAKKLGIEI